MWDIGQGLWAGFGAALTPLYFYYALIGAILGTITGVLPGLGPLGAMAILLSFTLRMDATGAMILFAGHLLRRHVRRLHHLHPAQHPGRVRIGRHLHRRVPDGQERARRGGPDRQRRRLLRRRDHQHHRAHGRGPLPFGHRPPVRAGGIFGHRRYAGWCSWSA